MNRNNSNGINKTNGNTPVKNSSSSINTKATNSSVILNNSMVATNETIKIVSESIGITNLNEESARELASDLTFIVKSILTVGIFEILITKNKYNKYYIFLNIRIEKDAQKYARRSRRKKIVPSDIDYALKTRALEVLIYNYLSQFIMALAMVRVRVWNMARTKRPSLTFFFIFNYQAFIL